MIYIRDIIKKKKEKKELTEDEIRFFVFGYFQGEISDAQAAALITSLHIYGLSLNEVIEMTKAIAETGQELELYRVSNKMTDIHSLGGISDKVILTLLSVLDSLNIPTGKVTGRELGMEDRLSSINGYEIDKDVNAFRKKINNGQIAILKNMEDLAPVEDKLYKLRKEIACDGNIDFIAISIMSQKIALGFSNIFFEITYGENAYVKTLKDAKKLARCLKNIGNKLMRNVTCAIIPLNEITGKCFGNILELSEIYDYLNGKLNQELNEIILNYGSNILINSEICHNIFEGREKIRQTISNGNALKSFCNLLKINSNLEDLTVKTKNVIPITSNESGFIEEIDINKLRMLAQYINAIRVNENDKLDVGAGIIFNKKVGDIIEKGEILMYIYTNNNVKIFDSVTKAKDLIKITSKKTPKNSRIKFNI